MKIKFLKAVMLFVLFSSLPTILFAQELPPDGHSPLIFKSWFSILLMCGAFYGVYKMAGSKRIKF